MADKSVMDLAQEVEANPALANEIRNDPATALAKQATAAYTTDRKFYRIAVIGLMGIIVLVIVSAVVVQVWKEQNISDWESALATTALGGLVGLFAPSPGATK
jgi:di/tricarboxylate transporter